jgi:drug/metabolite transporter (DMT)-like permease
VWLTAIFVAVRIVANPVSNVFQKKLAEGGAHPVFLIAATHALLTLAALPFARAAGLDAAFWADMGLCAALAVAGNVLLVYALRSTDLSILGPINAYKAVVSLALAVVVLGEIPSLTGLAGVALIVAGSGLVVERGAGNAFARFFRDRGVQLRFAALAVSATEAVFLKRAILRASPEAAFLWWSILGLPVGAAAAAILVRGRIGQEAARFRHHWRSYVCLALATGLMQLTTLLTFGKLPVGYSLALFQLSSLIGVFFGYRYFDEVDIRRRLAASTIMVAGAVLIITR